jgi:hypothetical protein
MRPENQQNGSSTISASRVQIYANTDPDMIAARHDEADAPFGKRSETRDAHDRYANHMKGIPHCCWSWKVRPAKVMWS